MKLGLISYDYNHLKTEQLVHRYTRDKRIEAIKIFALPFLPRKNKKVVFQHRPNMTKGLHTQSLAEFPKVEFSKWDGKQIIGKCCDAFVIGGAGILDIGFAEAKPIINAHPGIIPLTRGLDSFKWAIYNGHPVGVTLHLIDNEIDKGKILTIEHTPVFSTDTIQTFARRHYELEIEMLTNIIDVMSQSVRPVGEELPTTMRMNSSIEVEMIKRFDDWKTNMLNKISC